MRRGLGTYFGAFFGVFFWDVFRYRFRSQMGAPKSTKIESKGTKMPPRGVPGPLPERVPKKVVFFLSFWGCPRPSKLSSRLGGSSIFTFSTCPHFGTKMAPKMEPKWSQDGSQTRSEAVLEGSRSLLKNRLKNDSKNVRFWGSLGSPLGRLWEAF